MIIGAGLAGTLAAYMFPRELVFETHNRSWVEHQAVLRFRSLAVSELTGIPFRRVQVRKGIWTGEEWTLPTIDTCNRYAHKTIGRLTDRSIWDIASVERYVAPPDLRERMCDALGARIRWEHPVDLRDLPKEPIISTVPMSAMTQLLFMDPPQFRYAPICTLRMQLQDTDVFQTVYFPSPVTTLYRASITGNLLICEWATENPEPKDMERGINQIVRAFGLTAAVGEQLLCQHEPRHTQQFGKIAPIDESLRRQIVLELTKEHGIYSLGRFATWRNILLDDVVHDAAVIKRLMTAADDYDRILGRPLSTRSV